MIILPLYTMREYSRIFKEQDYLCVETAKNRYVLDYADIIESSYSARRLKLLADSTKPYKLYPINLVINSIQELMSVVKKYRNFFTDAGKVYVYKPQKFYSIDAYKIESYWPTTTGRHVIFNREIGPLSAPSFTGEPYMLIVAIGVQRLLYGYWSGEGPRPRRIKL
jgi:hypothetical protein